MTIERVRYFEGQLLSAADFAQEQAYQLAKSRRHNRWLHGWGVVSGLTVALDGNVGVRVSPGTAIDCAGNELVLDEPVCFSLAGLMGKHYVVMRYVEQLVEPRPAPDGTIEFARVRETVNVAPDASHPAAGHRRMGPGTPGCGEAHALRLATLSQKGTRWRLAAGAR